VLGLVLKAKTVEIPIPHSLATFAGMMSAKDFAVLDPTS
jgi:hypothetical protein